MSPIDFITVLSGLDFEDTFNPYSDKCPVHDRSSAPTLRRGALYATLVEALRIGVESVWIGRDLGYRGGRRTGLALTDDVHLAEYAVRWGIAMDRPTKGPPMAERTAAIVWSVLALIDRPVFLWNVFPLHPHDHGDPFSNRAHNGREAQAGEALLADLLKMLKPPRIVAIGNDAARVALRVASSQKVCPVRHPSYGGQRQFVSEVRSSYGV